MTVRRLGDAAARVNQARHLRQNIVIDYRFAEGRFDRLPDLAAELVRLKAEVIVAGPTPVAVAAKNATGTIPIVMWAVGDPVRQCTHGGSLSMPGALWPMD